MVLILAPIMVFIYIVLVIHFAPDNRVSLFLGVDRRVDCGWIAGGWAACFAWARYDSII